MTENQNTVQLETAEPTSIPNTPVGTPQASDEIVFNGSEEFATKRNRITYTEEKHTLFIAEDGGASTTRILPMEKGSRVKTKEIRTFESPYAIVEIDEDFSMYKVSSDSIEDNAEYVITELPESPHITTSHFKEPVRVIKGSLISRVGRTAMKIDNQKDKSQDIGIFINNLTAIANIALERGIANLDANLALSVPPKERYASGEKLTLLRQTLAGVYLVEMPRYGFAVRIEITDSPKTLFIEAEGELPYIYYVTFGKDVRRIREELEGQYVTIQDLGYSTFNQSLVKDGEIQSGITSTTKYGGANLVSKLYRLLSRGFDYPVTMEQAKNAVETGYIVSGPRKIPVGVYLTSAKIEVADFLYQEHVAFLQDASIHANLIHSNLFVGRGFLETGAIINGDPDEAYSPSIAHILSDKYRKLSPDTRAVILENPGLANLLGLASVMRSEWGI